ncbi:MAG: hypothetical protein R3F43_12565 [bacterium]
MALSAWLTPIAALPDGLVPDGLRGRARRRLAFDLGRLSLPIHHVAALDERRWTFFHNAANDAVTPGLSLAEELDREFPSASSPTPGMACVQPQGVPVPVEQRPFEDTRLALLEVQPVARQLADDAAAPRRHPRGWHPDLARFTDAAARQRDALVRLRPARRGDARLGEENVIFESRPMSGWTTAPTCSPCRCPGRMTLDAFGYHSDLWCRAAPAM